jgi:hypothetical protein
MTSPADDEQVAKDWDEIFIIFGVAEGQQIKENHV